MSATASDAPLQANFDAVLRRIRDALARAGRPGDVAVARGSGERESTAPAVRLVTVTKTRPAGIIRHCAELGVSMFGENRVQDAEPKILALGNGPEWHLIGHLQTNKVRRAVALFDWIHSIDDPALLERVDRVASELGRRPRVLLQFNVSGEPSKTGASESDAPALVAAALAARHVAVCGLMTMAPESNDQETTRPVFRKLKRLLDTHRQDFGPEFRELSMGMSGDYEVAVEEGATLVRIGSALFHGVGTDVTVPNGADEPNPKHRAADPATVNENDPPDSANASPSKAG